MRIITAIALFLCIMATLASEFTNKLVDNSIDKFVDMLLGRAFHGVGAQDAMFAKCGRLALGKRIQLGTTPHPIVYQHVQSHLRALPSIHTFALQHCATKEMLRAKAARMLTARAAGSAATIRAAATVETEGELVGAFRDKNRPEVLQTVSVVELNGRYKLQIVDRDGKEKSELLFGDFVDTDGETILEMCIGDDSKFQQWLSARNESGANCVFNFYPKAKRDEFRAVKAKLIDKGDTLLFLSDGNRWTRMDQLWNLGIFREADSPGQPRWLSITLRYGYYKLRFELYDKTGTPEFTFYGDLVDTDNERILEFRVGEENKVEQWLNAKNGTGANCVFDFFQRHQIERYKNLKAQLIADGNTMMFMSFDVDGGLRLIGWDRIA